MEYRKRKQIRLKGYNYSQNGSYFITISTHNREMIFGSIENGEVHLSEFGKIALDEISETNRLRKKFGIFINEFVIMPNHVHMIIQIVGTDNFLSAVEQCEDFSKPTKQSVSTVVRAYKAAVTKRIREFGKSNMNVPYEIWQGRFHDHIIRSINEYNVISKYIAENPWKWKDDCFYIEKKL